jgi:hypothetical protein
MAASTFWANLRFATCGFAELDYFSGPQISGPGVSGVVLFLARNRADPFPVETLRLLRGWVLLCTGRRTWIFDSLVLNLSHREQVQNDRQQTLNCALSVDFLWKQRFRSDKLPALRMKCWVYEKSDLQTFGSLTGTDSFLTESLILAQNERWRRG